MSDAMSAKLEQLAEALDRAEREFKRAEAEMERDAAEIARLRDALERIARIKTDLSGDFSLSSKQSEIARVALEPKP
jgi:chromosome segregation ATPase